MNLVVSHEEVGEEDNGLKETANEDAGDEGTPTIELAEETRHDDYQQHYFYHFENSRRGSYVVQLHLDFDDRNSIMFLNSSTSCNSRTELSRISNNFWGF